MRRLASRTAGVRTTLVVITTSLDAGDVAGGAVVADSPFGSFNDREPHALFPGVELRAIAGDQVFLGRVTYAPGTTVARHSHEHTEQVMLILDGSLTMTIGDDIA